MPETRFLSCRAAPCLVLTSPPRRTLRRRAVTSRGAARFATRLAAGRLHQGCGGEALAHVATAFARRLPTYRNIPRVQRLVASSDWRNHHSPAVDLSRL